MDDVDAGINAAPAVPVKLDPGLGVVSLGRRVNVTRRCIRAVSLTRLSLQTVFPSTQI